MRQIKFSSVFAFLLAIFIATAGSDLFAQGKGKGRGNGGERGAGQRPERGGDRGRGRSDQRQEVRQQQSRQVIQDRGNDRRVQMQQQRQRQMRQATQNRGNDRRVQMQQRQQMRQAMQNRGNDRRVQMQQRQQQARQVIQNRGNDRRIQMQQQRQMQQAQRQQARQQVERRGIDRRAGRNQNTPQIIPQRKIRNMFPQIAAANRAPRGSERSNRRESPGRGVQRQAPPFTGNWPDNFGQQRRAYVQNRNAERREARSYRNQWSDRDFSRRDGRRVRLDRGSQQFWSPGVMWQQAYTQTYVPNYRPRTFYESYVYPQAQAYPYSYPRTYNNGYVYSTPNARYRSYDSVYPGPYYAYDDYDRPSGTDILRSVIFAVLGGGMPIQDEYAYSVGGYEPIYGGGYSPAYAGYGDTGYYPATYASTDLSYYDPYFHEDPYYAKVLPIQHFVSDAPGGGLFRQMFTQLLAIGYDQGYQDGLHARQIAERDRTFYDPYAYDNAVYDPYSVSLGDNRRCLSQGYELGYEDAINNELAYDQFNNGEVDLVSVLIGAVSQLI